MVHLCARVMRRLERGATRHAFRCPGSSVPSHLKRAAIACLILGIASPAPAQYFGRNKVRYRTFAFQVMKTEHFDIYFYPREREGADIAARLAERWYVRLRRLFGQPLSGRQPLVLYATHADFEQTNIVAEEITEATGGFTEPARRRIVLPLAGPIRDTDHVLGHELVHAFQFDMAGLPSGQNGDTPFADLPLWFVEGMAEYVSLGRIDANTAMKVRDAAQRNQLPSIADLEKPKYFPYQWGHAVFAYIAGRYGELAIPRLLRAGVTYGDAAAAIKSALGISAQELSTDWHAATRALYGPVLSASRALPAEAHPAVTGRRFGSELNIAPALSPDGRRIAFLSTRGLVSIDLYVADADSGHIVRRLTSTATDGHYSSIQFINSAATWDPSSEHVAIGTIVAGRAALAIFDARTGKRVRDIVLDSIDEVLNPSWAPDGHAIAFTGMRQGLTDLYVYDLGSARLQQLTCDAYADVHPAWSPDSRRLVFSTDRFSSDLDALRMGPYQLAVADVASGALEPLPAFATGKHINPRWSSDGQALYFIADPDGVPNVYRRALAGGRIDRITALGIGVSGITVSSPALSVSSAQERVAVSTYEDERYNIYVWNGTEAAAALATLPVDAAVLPPVDRPTAATQLSFAASDPTQPPAEPYPTTPYKARLSLDGVGQPAAGVGVGTFGPIVGGGAAFSFSDALGDQVLAAAVQVGTSMSDTFSFSDVAFEAAYVRRDHRWNVGFVGSQIPYTAAAFEQTTGTADTGEPVQIDRQSVYRETHRSGAGILLYPFDRSRRVELRGGLSQTAFDEVVSSTAYSLSTGDFVSQTQEKRQLGGRINLATSAAAFVSDSASFGPTSPIQGQRYRLEAAPTFGSIDFTGVLADYRRYLMPIPFYTLAARVIHYGRYGAGAQDPRLRPIFLNEPGLVRGYDTIYDLAPGCLVTALGPCASGDRLVGSRILVGNLELRFPLLRPFGASRAMYGPLPVEIALFGDGGVAWNRGEKPALLGGSRPGIGSAGIAARIGLGFAVAELDLARPFQRPGEGWRVGFNLIPGW
jgi:Tol biopolymer transport system component